MQKNLRKEECVELTTDEVKTAIFHSKITGLCSLGINFTGGEALGNRDDLFEILEYTQSLGIKYRLNTNSWWSNKTNFTVGNQYFKSGQHLALYLKSLGIEMFAFSYDERLANSNQRKNLISAIKTCEKLQIKYQLIFTGFQKEEIIQAIVSLTKNCGRLKFLIPVSMQMVDIGGGKNVNKEIYFHQSNKAPCNKKGFYRPTTLHISPDGNVRTCMYAVGLNNCGNLRKTNLLEIVENFQHRNDNCLFSNPEKFNKFEKEMFAPYIHHYQSTIHECTRYAIMAKVAEMIKEYPQMDLDEIHKNIAQIF